MDDSARALRLPAASWTNGKSKSTKSTVTETCYSDQILTEVNMTKRHIIWGASIAVLAGILVAQTQQRTPAQPVQSAPGGRYQLVINPNIRADTFLLDTATGRIWIPVEYSGLKGNPTAWTPQTRVDSESALYAWEQSQTVKPETTTPEPK